MDVIMHMHVYLHCMSICMVQVICMLQYKFKNLGPKVCNIMYNPDRCRPKANGICTGLRVSGYVHIKSTHVIHTYIHTHTCMHACIHIYIHTYIHSYIHTYIHAYIHAYIHTHTYTHAQTHARTHTHTHTHTHTYTHIHACICTYSATRHEP